MRIWLFPPYELDNKRLVAAHNEWHAVETMIRRDRKRWLGWEDPRYLSDFYGVHEALVAEMGVRGFLHHTPPKYEPRWSEWYAKFGDDAQDYPREEWATRRDRWEVLTRWGGKFKGRYTDDLEAWAELEAVYAKEGGCQHDGRWFKLRDGYELCGTCKNIVRRKGDHETATYIPLERFDLREEELAGKAIGWRKDKSSTSALVAASSPSG